MNRLIVALFFVVSVLFANGCGVMEAVQVVNMATNARSTYQGYEALSMLKSVKDKTPVFKNYQDVFIGVATQPRSGKAEELNRTMADAYSATLNDMGTELGSPLNCRPYSETDVASAQDALVIQVEEIKQGRIGTIMSGENIHAKVRYIDKKSTKILIEEEYNPLKDYRGLLQIMSTSAMLKLLGNGPGADVSKEEQKAWGEKVKKFIEEKSKKYPVLTPEQTEILSQG